MDRRAFILTAPLALAACGNSVTWAPDDFVSRSTYVEPGPKYIKLYTVRNVGSDNGAHSGLLINASQRVLWDPAGSFGHSSIPERNDVLFGISPRVEQAYLSYHSRVTYYTQIQQFMLSPDVAEQALQLALNNGPTPKSFCTTHTSRLLMQLPGFGSVRTTFFPNNLADQLAKLPGVIASEYRETDADDRDAARAAVDAEITQAQ